MSDLYFLGDDRGGLSAFSVAFMISFGSFECGCGTFVAAIATLAASSTLLAFVGEGSLAVVGEGGLAVSVNRSEIVDKLLESLSILFNLAVIGEVNVFCELRDESVDDSSCV